MKGFAPPGGLANHVRPRQHDLENKLMKNSSYAFLYIDFNLFVSRL
jgi:hypothetical protein